MNLLKDYVFKPMFSAVIFIFTALFLVYAASTITWLWEKTIESGDKIWTGWFNQVDNKLSEAIKWIDNKWKNKADENGVVNLTGDQTIKGEKEFSKNTFFSGDVGINTTNLSSKLNLEGNINLNWNKIINASNVCDRTFSSCKAILKAGCSEGDGEYTIDPDNKGPKQAINVYCDMSKGYTFKYISGGEETCYVHNSNSCRSQGMMIFTPTSKTHYDAAINYVKNVKNMSMSPDMLGPLGIYSPVPGEDGSISWPYNFDEVCKGSHMTSKIYVKDALNDYQGWTAPCPFTSLAGDYFWTAPENITTDIEPNGDYNSGSRLIWQGWNGNYYMNDWNDNDNNTSDSCYSNYLCMANEDKQP